MRERILSIISAPINKDFYIMKTGSDNDLPDPNFVCFKILWLDSHHIQHMAGIVRKELPVLLDLIC